RREPGSIRSSSTLRISYSQDAIDCGALKYLTHARRPLDDDAVDPLPTTQSEMEAAIVLTGESGSTVYDPPLLETSRLQLDLGADRTAIAAHAQQLEPDPVIRTVRNVAVNDRRLILIGDDDILLTTIPEVGERHRAPVVQIRRANLFRNIHPAGDAAIQIDSRWLVSRETRISERRPARGVFKQSPIGARDLRHRIPVAPVAIRRDEAVGDEELVSAVVVEIAELRAPGPAGIGDLTFRDVAKPLRFGHLVQSQIVVLEQIS